MVTLSYGHGVFDDCNDTTGWSETESGLTSALTVENGDYFKIEGTCDNAADEYAYYEKNVTDISTNTFPKALVRWKTSEASNGLQAKIEFVYTVGSKVETLGFSQTWKVTSVTLDADKTLDKIRIYADDNPNSIDSGTYQVYFDFILVYKGDFTLPNAAGGMDLDCPSREAVLPIFGRDTDILQFGGTESVPVTLTCDLDQGTWKRAGDVVDGQVFLDIWHNRSTEPWQWFNSEVGHKFKVTVHPRFNWRSSGGATNRTLTLTLKEISLGNKNAETEPERFGHI